jgi:predicted RNA-binding Zn-ribbon protein involved in translation (DUF1610 family)
MRPQPDQRRSPLVLELPTGKRVEVSYFSADESAVRRPPGAAPQGLDLHRCPECASDLVYPTDWRDADERSYELALRCPNCEWTEVGTHDWDTVQRLDNELDRGERALIDDLGALTRTNVEEDFDRFIAALRAGQVWPIDF